MVPASDRLGGYRLSDEGSITRWISDLKAGHSTAAAQLWRRYHERLVRLAVQKLRGASRRMADEEDVVVDAFDSFCRGVQAGRFSRLDDRDDLWQILVTLTARKAINQWKRETRQRRGGRPPAETDSSDPDVDQIVGSEPTPDFAALVAEEFRLLLARLDDDTLRGVAVAKLEGYHSAEIAQQMGVQTRTVERKLRLIREIWSEAGA